MVIARYQAKILKKLGKLPPKLRKKHLANWPSSAFKDIRSICSGICTSTKLNKNTLRKIKSKKKIIRKISKSNPATVKNILSKQKGSGLFTAIAAGLIPLIASLIKK